MTEEIKNFYRAVLSDIINQDKSFFNCVREKRTPDGYGGYEIIQSSVSYEGRIYNRNFSNVSLNISGAVVQTGQLASEKLLTLSQADVRAGDTFDYSGRKLRVRFVKDYLGICKQVELEAVEDVEGNF